MHPPRRTLQNFILIWLDADINDSKNDFHNSITHLKNAFLSINTFLDADECIDFLSEIQNKKVFMIVSRSFGQNIVPLVHNWSQLDSIYVFTENQSPHEQCSKQWSKVKGVYTRIEVICEALQLDRERCDRDSIPISFSGIDPSFMYTQLFKEVLLKINDEDEDQCIRKLAAYCRSQVDISENVIDKVEKEYHLHTPIWWYTGPYFLYGMLNRALRALEVDIILKLSFFIRQLHRHIEQLHSEQMSGQQPTQFKVYRGQGLSITGFEKMKRTRNGLMSFNNFLSTSRDEQVPLAFAHSALQNSDMIGIFFVMTIDPSLCASTPFALLDNVSYYNHTEEEILFSTHTIFRIDKMKPIGDENNNRLWQVDLTMTPDNDLKTLTEHMQKELYDIRGWFALGKLLIQMGESEKAGQLYQLLLEGTTNPQDSATCNSQIGFVYDRMGEYTKALSYYKNSLAIYEKTLPSNHPKFADYYNNIGLVYTNMGEYAEALSFLEKAQVIWEKALPPNHPNLASSYNNIGAVHDIMGEYAKVLPFYEKALAIREIILPSNHPSLAISYNNIALVYMNMADYANALLFYEKAVAIGEKALPSNHPDLATSYNSIGLVYRNMGDYVKALSFFKKALAIREKAHSSNHPDLASSYSNIAGVCRNIGEYTTALSLYELALAIGEKTLPLNHPDLATSYNNIGLVYTNMDEYVKALPFYEKSLDIYEKTLPPNHRSLASSYNNISRVHYQIGDYTKALSFLEKALSIFQKSLSPTHPDVINCKKGIEIVKKKL